MAVINPTQTNNSTGAAGVKSKFSTMTSEEFTKIMFSELSHQDPLKPNDTNAMIQQMSSIRQIEANLALESKLTTLVTQNQLATAGNLVGAYVAGLDENFNQVEGQVFSISRTDSGPVLNLRNGARIPFDSLQEIALPPQAPTTPTPTPTTPPRVLPLNDVAGPGPNTGTVPSAAVTPPTTGGAVSPSLPSPPTGPSSEGSIGAIDPTR